MALSKKILFLELALIMLSPVKLHSQQYKNKTISIKAKNLVAEMTLDEKIGQMTQVDHRYLEQKSDIKTYCLGSLLSGGDRPRIQIIQDPGLECITNTKISH